MKNANKKQVVFLIILALFVAFFSIAFLVKGRQVGKKIITRGDRAPEFRLQALDGRTVSLSDFHGRVVMVHFWATWCPPCVEEMPTLDGLHRAFRGRDFELLTISVDEGGTDAVAAFMKRNRLNLPVVLDPERMVAGLYGTFKFPETYIVDREGMVRYKAIGPRDWSNPVNVRIVQDIIQAK